MTTAGSRGSDIVISSHPKTCDESASSSSQSCAEAGGKKSSSPSAEARRDRQQRASERRVEQRAGDAAEVAGPVPQGEQESRVRHAGQEPEEDAEARVVTIRTLLQRAGDEDDSAHRDRDRDHRRARRTLPEEQPGGEPHEEHLRVAEDSGQPRTHVLDRPVPDDQVEGEERTGEPGRGDLIASKVEGRAFDPRATPPGGAEAPRRRNGRTPLWKATRRQTVQDRGERDRHGGASAAGTGRPERNDTRRRLCQAAAVESSGSPLNVRDYERLAEETLDEGSFGYFAGGSGDEHTLRANLEAFDLWRTPAARPRRRHLGGRPRVSVLGNEISMPDHHRTGRLPAHGPSRRRGRRRTGCLGSRNDHVPLEASPPRPWPMSPRPLPSASGGSSSTGIPTVASRRRSSTRRGKPGSRPSCSRSTCRRSSAGGERDLRTGFVLKPEYRIDGLRLCARRPRRAHSVSRSRADRPPPHLARPRMAP